MLQGHTCFGMESLKKVSSQRGSECQALEDSIGITAVQSKWHINNRKRET